jgi:hypothetical protein
MNRVALLLCSCSAPMICSRQPCLPAEHPLALNNVPSCRERQPLVAATCYRWKKVVGLISLHRHHLRRPMTDFNPLTWHGPPEALLRKECTTRSAVVTFIRSMPVHALLYPRECLGCDTGLCVQQRQAAC